MGGVEISKSFRKSNTPNSSTPYNECNLTQPQSGERCWIRRLVQDVVGPFHGLTPDGIPSPSVKVSEKWPSPVHFDPRQAGSILDLFFKISEFNEGSCSSGV